MVKLFCHKILAITLSLLVLFSTLSFTVEKHFCGDTLVEIAIFSDVNSCSPNEDISENKKPCCKDVIDLIEGQDDLIVKTFDDINFSQQLFLTTFVFTSLMRFEDLSKQDISYKHYKPPIIVEDIQLLHDTFLI